MRACIIGSFHAVKHESGNEDTVGLLRSITEINFSDCGRLPLSIIALALAFLSLYTSLSMSRTQLE